MKDGLFWGLGSYEERLIWKKAGFKFSAKRRAWITDSVKTAQSVAGVVWTERAMAHIFDRYAVRSMSREMSYKASTDFTPPSPEGLTYRPFQCAGVEYAIQRKDTLIADPPGLGKTIQAIGTFNAMEGAQRALVVVPASLKENWRREIEKWKTHDVSVGIAETSHIKKVPIGKFKSGKRKGQTRFKNEKIPEFWPDTDVVIINYDILDRFTSEIHEARWDLLICDEAHALKTETTNRTLFVLGGSRLEQDGKRKKRVYWNPVEARRRVFLTGTPILSRPIELWPMVRAFDPDGLGRDYLDFVYDYCNARTTLHGLDVSGASNQKELGRRLRAGFMVRRNKREVLPELPPVTRQVVVLDSPEIREVVAREDELAQALRLFESEVLGVGDGTAMERFEATLGNELADRADAYGLGEAMSRSEMGTYDSRALNLDYAAAVTGLEPPAVAILFEELAKVRRELGLAKMKAVGNWVTEFLRGSQDEKLILFAYHADVVKGLFALLEEFEPALIYGATPLKKRQGQVDRFQEDDDCRVIVGNLHAMGVGFTMTRGANVAFGEGDWVPSLMLQGEDRACRIGQEADRIMSSYLVANGSLDSRIAQSAKEKQDNIDLALDT